MQFLKRPSFSSRFFTPARSILFFFVVSILIGVILLCLPKTTTHPISLFDKLFTITSAITVTGLIVVDTAKDYTPFGQFIILLFIQIGGLGYMTYSTFYLLAFKKLGYKEKLKLVETLNYPTIHGIFPFFKKALIYSFLIELTGAILLFPFFLFHGYPLLKALWISIFHAVSAFNNAGFSIFSTSLENFAGSIYLNLVMIFLIVLGGLGFFVLQELEGKLLYKRKFSPHTKMVLLITGILILTGFCWFFFIEFFHNPEFKKFDLKTKFLASLFTSVTSRTAGFNTIDIGKLSEPSLFFLSFLMFIGGSPGGTAGGIKTTNLMIVLLTIYSFVKGERDVVFLKRRVNEQTVKKAFVVITLAFFIETLVTFFLVFDEKTPFIRTLFEVVSAFSTVGLSTGNGGTLSFCANFDTFGKVVIILSMLIGRVGFLSFLVALAGEQKQSRVRYVEGNFLT